MSPLCRLPLELLEAIATHIVADSPIAALLPLQLTCKYVHKALSIHTNSHFYASLFTDRFDVSAASRRFGSQAGNSSALVSELMIYSCAIQDIRCGNIHARGVLDAFWIAFKMLTEDDGKNRRALEAAGLPDFVDRFVRERLYERDINGWPAESDINSLALWLLWLTSSEERLQAESPAQRSQLTRLILPFVLMPIRYPVTYAPYVHFSLPLQSHPSHAPHSVPTLHGPYPRYRDDNPAILDLYHSSQTEVAIPLASTAAKLIYFSRKEVFPIGVPPHLPLTREHAFQLGLNMVGPTQEDVHELNAHKVAKLVEPADANWQIHVKGWEEMSIEDRANMAPSARWDNDWNRLTDCNTLYRTVSLRRSHYTPGSLAGLWQGRMLVPDNGAYGHLFESPDMPSNFSEPSLGVAAVPLFMRLREYHCMDVEPNKPVPAGRYDDPSFNAWFPSSMTYQEIGDKLSISYLSTSTSASGQQRSSSIIRKHVYNAYNPDGPTLHDESQCRGCQDRGTCEMVFRSEDARFLAEAGQQIDGTPLATPLPADEDEADDTTMDVVEGEDEDDTMDVDQTEEVIVKRRCDGIMDIVLVGETDTRHAQAWHPYRFYGRVREWDGLIVLVRVPGPTVNPHPLGASIFMGYLVGGQTLVGNWRMREHPNEPVTFEGAWAMSKRP
ncbi:hypothetical protein V8B97DRAFT_754883 [Scleroderma yunnanense]